METLEREEKTYSMLQWLIFVIIIPLLFTITLALVLLTFAGVDVVAFTKEHIDKVPFVSSVFKQENEKKEDVSIKNQSKKIEELQALLDEKELSIKKLTDDFSAKEKEVKSLSAEIERLSNEIASLQNEQLAEKKSVQEIAKIYEKMSPKNAAIIIPKLENNDAVKILSNLNADKLVSILEKMEPEEAALYTKLLTE
ncbi:hypothetical protein LCL95_03360 [Bacillus timonensis]|nr:hypothetical protein [Bacillus timonensis]